MLNVFAELPPIPSLQADEVFTTLLEQPGLKIERIISTGQASPPGFWYAQPQLEWVLLLSGEASLRFEDEPQAHQLHPGDFVKIDPMRRHRVEETAQNQATVWLAIHYSRPPAEPSFDQKAEEAPLNEPRAFP